MVIRFLAAEQSEGGATRAVRKDFKENFYHGLILGILLFKDNWDVSSNRESGAAHREAILNGSADLAGATSEARADTRGDGFYDIQIEIEEEEIGIIIEVKYAEGGILQQHVRRLLYPLDGSNPSTAACSN